MSKYVISSPLKPTIHPAPTLHTAQPKSGIIYSGPSLLDGKPIVVIATLTSSNDKTGNDTLQCYIIRSDIDPMLASKTGEDYSVCGNCKHRGDAHDNEVPKQALERSCYVLLWQAPTQVYKAYQRGNYKAASAASIGAGRFVRLGAYGDPASVPGAVWSELLSQCSGFTGYSHQIATPGADVNTTQVMLSADSKDLAAHYHYNGKRTFRVIPISEWKEKGKDALLHNEILCPASKEQGYKTTCAQCKLCNGTPDNNSAQQALDIKISERIKGLRGALGGVVDSVMMQHLEESIKDKMKERYTATDTKGNKPMAKSIAIVAHGTAKAKVK